MYKNISLNFDKLEMSYDFESAFLQHFGLNANNSYSLTYGNMATAATMFALIMSFVLILVAFLVLIIALIIVRFTIKSNIEEDIKTFGALKSIGYTSKQIIWSIIIQFLLIAVLGGIAGALLGLLVSGYVGNVVSATSGLLWSSASFFIPSLIAVLAIIAVTFLVTYLVARKSKNITPINALRQGLGNHYFKRNHAPLEKTKMPLNIAVAVKSFFGNIKNNITAFVVLFLFGFMGVLGFTLYHNFVTDTSAFKKMIGGEQSEVLLVAKDEQFALDNFSDIKKMDGVVKTVVYDKFTTTSDNKLVIISVWDDISKKDTTSLIDGRYPKLDNEISLRSTDQKILNKNIGDVINVEYEGVMESYLVTGITQGVSDDTSCMTREGFSRLKEVTALKGMYIFLNNSGTDYINNFADSLVVKYGNQIFVMNLAEAVNNTVVGLKDPVAIATYLVIAIMIFTVCFVFFLLINTIIRRRKKDFGIMKAVGFTSGQLIKQMLLSFLPVIVISVILGTVAGVFLTNPLLGLMFSGLGIAKAKFILSAGLTVISGAVLLGISVLTIYLISLKTRNISPQKLIVEQ